MSCCYMVGLHARNESFFSSGALSDDQIRLAWTNNPCYLVGYQSCWDPTASSKPISINLYTRLTWGIFSSGSSLDWLKQAGP